MGFLKRNRNPIDAIEAELVGLRQRRETLQSRLTEARRALDESHTRRRTTLLETDLADGAAVELPVEIAATALRLGHVLPLTDPAVERLRQGTPAGYLHPPATSCIDIKKPLVPRPPLTVRPTQPQHRWPMRSQRLATRGDRWRTLAEAQCDVISRPSRRSRRARRRGLRRDRW